MFLVAVLGVVTATSSTGIDLSGVNVHAVLAFFRERDIECDQVVADVMSGVLGQSFLFGAVLVQGSHKVSQWSRHAELAFKFTSGEYQGILVSDGNQTKEARSFHRSPFSTGAVW